MIDADKVAFAKMLTATMELYGEKPSRDAIALWWAALLRYSLEQVRQGLSTHIQDPRSGRFNPKPADIIAALTADDGRPNADEAWTLCPLEESQTAVWTTETKDAFFQSAYRMVDEDRIAARMAFKGAYDRLVNDSRRQGVPVKWEYSLGTDPHGRSAALERAVELGRLPRAQVQQFLPAPAPNASAVALANKFKGSH